MKRSYEHGSSELLLKQFEISCYKWGFSGMYKNESAGIWTNWNEKSHYKNIPCFYYTIFEKYIGTVTCTCI